MQYSRILITGGCGFVGSNLAVSIKEAFPQVRVAALDNFHRFGSVLNGNRLKDHGIEVIHGDIRQREDLDIKDGFDLVIECAAEASVLAGVYGSPQYVIQSNLVGAINCFEAARVNKADIVFLSTSRVYPIEGLDALAYKEDKTRFVLSGNQKITGASERGINESFSLEGVRTMYGATKLASELILREYINNYGMKGVVNRCGVITGPWQFGVVDQGFVALWIARHFFKNKDLAYIGYGGMGKQVRDFIHVNDLFEVVKTEIQNMDRFSGEVFNIGGGLEVSVSLQELTVLCQEVTGNKIPIKSNPESRPGDIRIYLSDATKFKNKTDWKPRVTAQESVASIYEWLRKNEKVLKPFFN